MVDDNDLQEVLYRASDLAKARLSDMSNYPMIDGKIAFVDQDVMWRYAKAHRSRPSDHLINYGMWDISLELHGDKIRCHIENRKMVSGSQQWNLVDDILSVGTTSYVSKRRMSFFDRYRNKWSFNRKERKGIGQQFVSGFVHMVKQEVHIALAEAMKEYNQGRL